VGPTFGVIGLGGGRPHLLPPSKAAAEAVFGSAAATSPAGRKGSFPIALFL